MSELEREWTKILGWPGYRVYRHAINEKNKTLKLWVRRKSGNQKLVCGGCGERVTEIREIYEREVRDLPWGEYALARLPHHVLEPFALTSRNGHAFASFADLAKDIAAALPNTRTVLDGEIVCLDKKGKPQFRDLLFRRGDPCFFAFDLLVSNGKDWRTESLMDRKQELRRLLVKVPSDSRLRYVDHVDGSGIALFQRVCKLDLEGIVAKLKSGPYVSERERTTWFKIRNREYSQMVGGKNSSNATGTTSQ